MEMRNNYNLFLIASVKSVVHDTQRRFLQLGYVQLPWLLFFSVLPVTLAELSPKDDISLVATTHSRKRRECLFSCCHD